MGELRLKQILREYLKSNNIKFKTEQKMGTNIIDFICKIDNKWIGIEVKGANSDLISTLGQIVNYYRYLSHLTIFAPEEFIKKFLPLIDNNPELATLSKKLGIITLLNGSVKTIREPFNDSYYFFIKEKKTEAFEQKTHLIDEVDKLLLELTKNGITLQQLYQKLQEVYPQVKLTIERLRTRLKLLEKGGYLEINTSLFPRIYLRTNKPVENILIRLD